CALPISSRTWSAPWRSIGCSASRSTRWTGEWRAHHNTIVGIVPQVTVEIDSDGSASKWAPAWKAVRAGEVVGFSVDRPEDVDAIVAAVSAAVQRVLQPTH